MNLRLQHMPRGTSYGLASILIAATTLSTGLLAQTEVALRAAEVARLVAALQDAQARHHQALDRLAALSP